MPKPEKVAKVKGLTERFRSSSGAMFADFRGLTVHDATELRRSLRGADASLAVLKDRIVGALQRGFSIDGHELRTSARVGIALFPVDGADADTLFNNAEAALRQAKASAARHVFYAPAMNARMAQRLAIESELVDAMRNDTALKSYQWLPSVRGDLLAKLDRRDEARAEFEHAAALAGNAREREFLLERARSMLN